MSSPCVVAAVIFLAVLGQASAFAGFRHAHLAPVVHLAPYSRLSVVMHARGKNASLVGERRLEPRMTGIGAVRLPAFFNLLDADVQKAIKLPLQELVNESDERMREKDERMREKDEYMEKQEKLQDERMREKDEYMKKQEKALLDSLDEKEQSLTQAMVREAELVREVVCLHAIFSPRVVVTSLVQACSDGSPRPSVGAKEVTQFVSKYVYEKDLGLRQTSYHKRNFTAAASAFLEEMGSADVLGIHQALDLLFQSLSRHHHEVCPIIAKFKGVVVGGPYCSSAEKQAYAMVIALGQQEVQRRTGAKPTDPVQDPIGIFDCPPDLRPSPDSPVIDRKLKRQITGGHVVLIQ